MKKAFISHPYSDNPELRLKQNEYICRNLPDDILPISPLHLFSFEDDDSRREEILQVCYDLIDMCEEVYVYYYEGVSQGQSSELLYANVEEVDIYILNPPEKCIKMGGD